MSEALSKRVPIPPKGVDYRGKLVLAPMVRSGELPSRLLALHYGADLVWGQSCITYIFLMDETFSNLTFDYPGPETVDHSMIGTTRRINPATNTIDFVRVPHYGQKEPPPDAKESVIYRLHPEHEDHKLIFQIGTSDPDRAVAAARLVASDVAGIDVNAGCPKPFSTSGGMGAALLKTPDKLVAILEALVKNIVPEYQIGISVKIRILETAEQTEALVRRLIATGITGLTVHCRTTPMRPREKAIRGQLKMVADVCHEAGVACIMNGDVEDRDSAAKLIEEFGVDGAMIATAAEKNSSCFRTQEQGGLAPWNEIVEKYLGFAIDTHNKWGNTKYMLCQIVPGKQPAYQKVQICKSYTSVCEILGYDHLLEKAKETDMVLGLAPKETQSKTNAGKNIAGKRKIEPQANKRPNEISTKRQKKEEPLLENNAQEAPQAAMALSA